jgi:hypothetical protein
MAILEVLNPVATTNKGKFPPPSPLEAISGKTIGVYWDIKRGGDVALERLGELIAKDYPDVRFKRFEHHDPVPDDMIDDMISQCDAVMGSTGD